MRKPLKIVHFEDQEEYEWMGLREIGWKLDGTGSESSTIAIFHIFGINTVEPFPAITMLISHC
jgi:hypothetical protein